MNPNSKIPAALDRDGYDGKPVRLFESASIMLYLCDKHQLFMPKNHALRAEVMNWMFWQMGGLGPMCGKRLICCVYFYCSPYIALFDCIFDFLFY